MEIFNKLDKWRHALEANPTIKSYTKLEKEINGKTEIIRDKVRPIKTALKIGVADVANLPSLPTQLVGGVGGLIAGGVAAVHALINQEDVKEKFSEYAYKGAAVSSVVAAWTIFLPLTPVSYALSRAFGKKGALARSNIVLNVFLNKLAPKKEARIANAFMSSKEAAPPPEQSSNRKTRHISIKTSTKERTSSIINPIQQQISSKENTFSIQTENNKISKLKTYQKELNDKITDYNNKITYLESDKEEFESTLKNIQKMSDKPDRIYINNKTYLVKDLQEVIESSNLQIEQLKNLLNKYQELEKLQDIKDQAEKDMRAAINNEENKQVLHDNGSYPLEEFPDLIKLYENRIQKKQEEIKVMESAIQDLINNVQ